MILTRTIALAGIAVLVLAVAGPILADILQAHQVQAQHRGFGGNDNTQGNDNSGGNQNTGGS